MVINIVMICYDMIDTDAINHRMGVSEHGAYTQIATEIGMVIINQWI